jgi:hypothetical protein
MPAKRGSAVQSSIRAIPVPNRHLLLSGRTQPDDINKALNCCFQVSKGRIGSSAIERRESAPAPACVKQREFTVTEHISGHSGGRVNEASLRADFRGSDHLNKRDVRVQLVAELPYPAYHWIYLGAGPGRSGLDQADPDLAEDS